MAKKNYTNFLEVIKSKLDSAQPENPYECILNFLRHKKEEKTKNYFENENGEIKKLERTEKIKNQITKIGGKLMSFDIGGSLCKICVYETDGEFEALTEEPFVLKECFNYEALKWNDNCLRFNFGQGRFSFVKFPTKNIEKALEILFANKLIKSGDIMPATGGGAFKYSSLFESKAIELKREDELSCLLGGLGFVLENVAEECYCFKNPSEVMDKTIVFEKSEKEIYPFILVNVGTGVSILLVNSPTDFRRVSGSFIGGGTFLGLCRLINKDLNFHELVEECKSGDMLNLSVTVKDIYGGDYDQLGMKGDIIASIFGKASENVSSGDVAISTINLVGVNISQLAHFCAKEHKVSRVLFAGNFLRQNLFAQIAVSSSLNYWSGGEMKALFLEHEGYFGSIGAILKSLDSRGK